MRLYDVNVPGGKLAAWFNFARAKGGTTQGGAVIPTANGFAFGIAHQRLEWHGGYNWFSVQYARGRQQFSTALDDPTPSSSSRRGSALRNIAATAERQVRHRAGLRLQRTHSGNPAKAEPLVSFARGRSTSLPNTSRCVRAGSTTRAAARPVRRGSANSQSRRRSARGVSSSAGPRCASFLTTLTGRTPPRLRRRVPFRDRTSASPTACRPDVVVAGGLST